MPKNNKDNEDNTEESEEKAEVLAEKPKKPRKKRVKGGKITRDDIKLLLLAIWKVILVVLRFIFSPFIYTGKLMARTYRFLKDRGDHELTNEEKDYLSLIPTMYLMLSISVTIVVVFFTVSFLEELWRVIASFNIWDGIVWFFLAIGKGIAWIFKGIFGGLAALAMLIGELLSIDPFLASFLVLFMMVIVAGLLLLLYQAPFTQKVIAAIRRFVKYIGEFPKKIGLWFKELHDKFKLLVLKYIIGEKLVETKTKNFFFITILWVVIFTIISWVFFAVYAIYTWMGVAWDWRDALGYMVFIFLIEFLMVGIFGTWFFHRMLGIATKHSNRYAIKT